MKAVGATGPTGGRRPRPFRRPHAPSSLLPSLNCSIELACYQNRKGAESDTTALAPDVRPQRSETSYSKLLAAQQSVRLAIT